MLFTVTLKWPQGSEITTRQNFRVLSAWKLTALCRVNESLGRAVCMSVLLAMEGRADVRQASGRRAWNRIVSEVDSRSTAASGYLVFVLVATMTNRQTIERTTLRQRPVYIGYVFKISLRVAKVQSIREKLAHFNSAHTISTQPLKVNWNCFRQNVQRIHILRRSLCAPVKYSL